MRDPIQTLCEISDIARLRREARASHVKILREHPVIYTDGTSRVQFTVEVDGVLGFLVPASAAAQSRQQAAGRHLKPYNFVLT